MQSKERLTNDLLEQIAHSESPDDFMGPEIKVEYSLSEYLNTMLEEKGLKRSEVIRNAHLNETFGYQIFSGQRQASRNKVLALAFALGLDLKETRRLLAHANVGDFYCKNRRDAILTFCISHNFDLNATDEELYKFGEETVSDGGGK